MGKSGEIISTVQRRRNWSTEEKVAILDAALPHLNLLVPRAEKILPLNPVSWRGDYLDTAVIEKQLAALAKKITGKPAKPKSKIKKP